MKHKLILSILSLVFGLLTITAQQKKPKVALVLSGGGAKGIAHIPVLQTLDSLGIVPDLVVGTSMGAAVGGLYAIGYSGDSIASIATQADWTNILYGEVSLNAVRVEEKSEFERYSANFDWIEGKPKLKNAILKDQNLREFLISLVYPVYELQSFDDYYIPFRAVSTDLVAGKEVILSEGSLGTAIRASISIPGVFSPVEYKETLLVDGGVVNNFPTDVAKRLGADIIIGSDVGEGLLPKEKLDNLPSVLFQTSMLTSGLKMQENRELCRVLINHNENITYSTQDFVQATGIYEQGKTAVEDNMTGLVELANYLNSFEKPEPRPKASLEKLEIDRVNYKNISRSNLDYVKAIMDIEERQSYTPEELKSSVDRAMGTEIFDQIVFGASTTKGETTLDVTGFEKAPNKIGGSLHYDTYQGVGVVVNYTGRNVIGNASRLVIGLDIAEQPKLRAQYQKNIGENRDFWWNFQVFGQNLEQSFFREGRNGEILKTRYWQTTAQLNKNLNPLKDYIGFDLGFFFNHIKPAINPDTNNNIYDLRKATYETVEFSTYYLRNTLDKVFFATKGSNLEVRLSRTFSSYANVEFQENTDLSDSGDTNGYFKLNADYEKRFQIKNDALVLRGTAGFIFEDPLKGDDLSIYEYGQLGYYQLGGQIEPNRRYAYAFKGISDGDLLTSQFIRFYLAYQFHIARNIYITPYSNLGVVGFGNAEDFFSNVLNPATDWQNTNETSSVFSLGTTFSYNSVLGPVHLDVAHLSGNDNLELYFGVGINLNIQK